MLWSVPMRPSDDAPGQMLGGSADSPVRIEVFSDFQCSACREFYLNTIRQVLQDYSSKDKVCIIYHEYPLTIHRYSREAARYSEAAARLGLPKLLMVMDAIFTDQALWSQDGKLDISVSKALSREDMLKLKKIMQDSSIDQAVEKEIKLGNKIEVKSTPTTLISYIGKQTKVEGAVIYPAMKQFLDRIVK
jgi:protein-disulfide isomerase